MKRNNALFVLIALVVALLIAFALIAHLATMLSLPFKTTAVIVIILVAAILLDRQ